MSATTRQAQTAAREGSDRSDDGPIQRWPEATRDTDPRRALHVCPYRDAWGIQVGEGDVERVFRSRKDAFLAARVWATREDRLVVVHGDEAPLEIPPA